VSRKVAALVDAGLVERRVDPADGRAHLLAVTPAGEQRCADGRRHRIAMVASVLSGWPEDSRRQLATLLGQFADGLQEHGANR
jgi:DNA-binding MarR family transcriptional regulator